MLWEQRSFSHIWQNRQNSKRYRVEKVGKHVFVAMLSGHVAAGQSQMAALGWQVRHDSCCFKPWLASLVHSIIRIKSLSFPHSLQARPKWRGCSLPWYWYSVAQLTSSSGGVKREGTRWGYLQKDGDGRARAHAAQSIQAAQPKSWGLCPKISYPALLALGTASCSNSSSWLCSVLLSFSLSVHI